MSNVLENGAPFIHKTLCHFWFIKILQLKITIDHPVKESSVVILAVNVLHFETLTPSRVGPDPARPAS